jgi:hypothetical protein
MKCISIERLYEQYFTFSHIPSKQGKRWKDYYHSIKNGELDEFIMCGEEYFINISWQGQVEVDLSW